jgi:hypothetical protein
MAINPAEYTSGASVAQRQPIYVDINTDPRAKSQAYLNMYSSRVGVPVIAMDMASGAIIGQSAMQEGIANNGGVNGPGNVGGSDIIPTSFSAIQSLLSSQSYSFDTPTNFSDSWNSNGDYTLTWTFDTTNGNNKYCNEFFITFTPSGGASHTFTSTNVNTSSSSQTYTLTATDNKTFFGFVSSFISVSIQPANIYGNVGPALTVTTGLHSQSAQVPTPINAPSLTQIYQGYTVGWDAVNITTYPHFQYVSIEESVDSGTTWRQVYLGTNNPATVIVSDLNARLVRYRYTDGNGLYGPYSPTATVTPKSVVNVTTTPADTVSSATGSFVNSGTGDAIQVQVVLPNPFAVAPVSFIIQLIPAASRSLTGNFYFYPGTITAGSTLTFDISSSDIFAQFGQYYPTYSGYVYSVSSIGNKSTGVTISSFSHTNNLSGITPTFSVVPAANGYTTTWTNIVGSTYADVYENSVSWGGTNPTDEALRVYSGSSPVTIQSLNYSTRYIKIRFYDNYGNASNYSAEKTVVPYNPGLLSLLSNPVAFQTNGSILAGSFNSSTGSLSYPNVIFNTSGIFAYDSGSQVTTQIINNAVAGGNTFITKQAQIADWSISPAKIENTLYGSSGSSTYVGLSGSAVNGYSIWAGSPTAGGSSLANFSVTPSGSVVARNITIIGNGGSSNLISAGGLFTVTNAGVVTATAANITGTIYAQGGQFTGNVQLNGGSLYAPKTTGIPSSVNAGVIFNGTGVAAYNGSGGVTQMLTTALADGSTFTTNAADIGGWVVGQSTITDSANQFRLDSLNKKIYIQGTGTNANNYLQLSTPTLNTYTSTNNVFESGATGALPSTYIDASGNLYANSAILRGTIIGGTMTGVIDGTTGHYGYYLDNNGYFGLKSTNGSIFAFNGSGLNVVTASADVINFAVASPSSGNNTNDRPSYSGGYSVKIGASATASKTGYWQNGAYFTGNLTRSGTIIQGLPVQGDADLTVYQVSGGGPISSNGQSTTYYEGLTALGPYPRQRMIIEDPQTGALMLGMAVYYRQSSVWGTGTPTGGSIGDLWVDY